MKNLISSLPTTQDGKPIFPGMPVYCIRTSDGGKTWFVVDKEVEAVGRFRTLTFCVGDKRRIWEAPMLGDNRIFAVKRNANAEAKRRNSVR